MNINEHKHSISSVFFFVLYHFILSGNFKARKFGMGFFGVKIWIQGFFWVLLEALGIFLGFDFCPHSIIPSL